MKNLHIMVNLTGSIACYKTCHLISKLVQDGHDVKAGCSRSALEFIGPATLEGLTGHPVHSDVFQTGQMMDHIDLTKWADLILLCPGTGNAINKLAHGIADDWIGSLFLANNFKKPYWIAPAMNTEMYNHPATQSSLARLKDWGCFIFDTAYGQLACGDLGKGKLVEPDIIFEKIKEFFSKSL